MHTGDAPLHPARHDSLLALACALAEARQEAARAGRIRYVYAAEGADWVTAAAEPPDRRAHYRVYPGGRTEHHPARRPRRRG